MKTMLLLISLLLSLAVESRAQKPLPDSARLNDAEPCVARKVSRETRRPVAKPVVPAPVESVPDVFVGEAMVRVTKDETVVRLAMAQHASVLIELPANDGPRYIIPGDPEMVTVDEKALERNKRAIIVRPGALFVVPTPNQRVRLPAATVTAQMRSGLVVTFLFYPVADPAQNVHRCVLTYQRDEVVARRRAAGLPVNLDQKEQGGEKPTGQSGAPASISVEPLEEVKTLRADGSSSSSVIAGIGSTSQLQGVKTHAIPIPSDASPLLATASTSVNERAVAVTKKQLARATTEPGRFVNWTRALHGLALAVQQDGETKEAFRVLSLAVKNTGSQSLKLAPGTPDLTLEMEDGNGKVINVQSIKPLHVAVSVMSGEVGAGQIIYYAIAYTPPLMGVRQRLKVVVAQTNAVDEPASIALLK